MVLRKILNKFTNIPDAVKCAFIHRSEDIVLFDAWFGGKFADNPRFLYQYLVENKEQLGLSHVVWVTRNEAVNRELNRLGYESYMIDSPESIYFHKHAKYHIVNNAPNDYRNFKGEVLPGLSYFAKRINLWHGVVGKGIGFASHDEQEKKKLHPVSYGLRLFLHDQKWFRQLFEARGGWGECYYATQSTVGFDMLKEGFRLPDKNIIMTGYPRVQECHCYTKEEQEIVDLIKDRKRVFLYLPTFRSNANNDFANLTESIRNVILENDVLWIQKAHSADKGAGEASADEHIITLNSNFDVNVLYPYITFLVTDYSSCFIDAMYFGKGLMFFVPDYDEYIHGDRGLMFDPEVAMAGPKCKTVAELGEAIAKYKDCPEASRSATYQQAYDLYWKETSHKNMKDIWTDIRKQVNE